MRAESEPGFAPSEAQINPGEITPGNPENQKEKAGMYFGAVGASMELMRGIGTKMRERFGKNSILYNSKKIFTSPEGMAGVTNQIRELASSGKDVTIIAHSIGSSEVVQAIADIPDLEQFAENIHLKRIASTTEVKNVREGFTFLGRMLKVSMAEQAIAFYKGSIFRGIVSLSSIPPNPETISKELLDNGIRKAFPEISLYIGSDKADDYIPDRNYFQHMPDEKRKKVEELDRDLADLLRDPERNKKQIRRKLHKRSRVTHSTIQAAYAGKFADAFGDAKAAEVGGWSIGALLGFTNILKDSFITPKMSDKLAEIEAKGVDIRDEYVPEYELTRRRGGSIRRRIVPGTSHTSPWAVQPEALEAVLD